MKITVNGKSVDWAHDSISFDDIQRIAFDGRQVGVHSVTYQNAAGENGNGNLLPSGSVKVQEGTTFNVFESGKA